MRRRIVPPIGGADQLAGRILRHAAPADRAFEWLEKAYRQRDGGLSAINGDPLPANIAGDPRYAAMLRRLKLAD